MCAYFAIKRQTTIAEAGSETTTTQRIHFIQLTDHQEHSFPVDIKVTHPKVAFGTVLAYVWMKWLYDE